MKPLTVYSPEHVAIALVPAGLCSRLTAFLIDALFVASVCAGIAMLGRMLPRGVSAAAVGTLCFVVTFGWPIWFETFHAGQTPGKRALRLRVVDARGLPISAQQSFVRNVVRALDYIPLGGLGMIAALLDRHHRRLGDLLADTLVVTERQPEVPDLESAGARRHNSLRTARVRRLLDHRVGLEERELLLALCLRAPALDARARYDLFESVGEHYRKKLDIDDQHLSGEAVVRGLTALCYGDAGGSL